MTSKETSKKTKAVLNSCSRCCLLAAAGLLIACGNYQAPISEQGRNQVVRSPEIISSNAGNEQSRVAPQTSTPTYSSDEPSARIQVSSSSDRPAAVVSTPETAPVSRNSITRRAIGQPASSAPSGTIAPSLNRTPIGSSSRPSSSAGIGSIGSVAPGLPSLIPAKHLVKAGDTLFSIAFQYDLDFRTLAMANGLNPPYTIFVGQEIDLAANVLGAVTDAVVNTAGEFVRDTAESRARSAINNSEGSPSPSRGPAPIRWQWPHRGNVLKGFQADISKGIDIGGNVGDPVLAAGAGDVVYSGRGVQGTGNLIIIRHSDRFLSAYAHNSAMLVPEGMHVEAGQQIAEVGVNSAGVPMLHFEIRQDGTAVDPTGYLPLR